MIQSITKRDGRVVLYDQSKIAGAILRALEVSGDGDAADAARVANDVQRELESRFASQQSPNIEAIQDTVERQLMNHGFSAAAKAYIQDLFGEKGWKDLSAVKAGNYTFLDRELFHFKPNHRWAEAYKTLYDLLYPESINYGT